MNGVLMGNGGAGLTAIAVGIGNQTIHGVGRLSIMVGGIRTHTGDGYGRRDEFGRQPG